MAEAVDSLRGALLLLVAFSKWLSIWKGAEVLAAVDPLTGIRYGTLLTVALFLELCLAYAAFEFPLGWGTLYGIGWLGSGFAGYRLARLHGDIEAPCKCLGHFLPCSENRRIEFSPPRPFDR